MDFRDLGLNASFCERLTRRNISVPSEIQVQVFQPLLEGKSLLGLSKTGTGKTLAYLAPLTERLYSSSEQLARKERNPRVLILLPTRELASQVTQELFLLTEAPHLSATIVGGESEDKQVQNLKYADWVIGTPGRILDLLKRHLLSLKDVESVIFDEADRLFDMGFVDDMRLICRFLDSQKARQFIFFSATLHLGVEEIAYELCDDIIRFGESHSDKEIVVDSLEHTVSFVGENEKFKALSHWLYAHKSERGIVFSNFRDKAHDISERLNRLGAKTAILTAQLPQNRRNSIMQDFREGKMQVLIASDLAARGIDIQDVDYVINYDLPEDPATYVHRVGRTARAGRKGVALSFVGFEDSFYLERLEKYLGKVLKRETLPDSFVQDLPPRWTPLPTRTENHRPQAPVAPHKPTEPRRHPHTTKPSAHVHKPHASRSIDPPAQPKSIWQRLVEKFAFWTKKKPQQGNTSPASSNLGSRRPASSRTSSSTGKGPRAGTSSAHRPRSNPRGRQNRY